MTSQDEILSRLVKLEVEMADVKSDIKQMTEDVRTVRDAIVQGKGSLKTISILAGAAGAIGAIISALWQKLFQG